MKKPSRLSLSIIILALLLGFGFGFYARKYIYRTEPVTITIPDSVIQEQTKHIDSLYRVEKEIKTERKKLDAEVRVIQEERINEINEIRKLPLDSGVNFLKTKLREYEE